MPIVAGKKENKNKPHTHTAYMHIDDGDDNNKLD